MILHTDLATGKYLFGLNGMRKIFTTWLLFLALATLENSCRAKFDGMESVKSSFFSRYEDTCLSFPMISEYLHSLHEATSPQEKRKYAVFVFQDNARAKIGGVGDRYAGLVTSFVWAMRSNRIFLVEDVSGSLSEYFSPIPASIYRLLRKRGHSSGETIKRRHHRHHKLSLYEAHNLYLNSTLNLTTEAAPKLWSDWKSIFPEFSERGLKSTHLYCVNPRSRAHFCALDDASLYNDVDLVCIRSNRAYLCRWALHPHLPAHQELKDIFGNHSVRYNSVQFNETNWETLAGCILRTVLWPTPAIWKQTQSVYDQYSTDGIQIKSQLGLHFRCGNHSFTETDREALTDA